MVTVVQSLAKAQPPLAISKAVAQAAKRAIMVVPCLEGSFSLASLGPNMTHSGATCLQGENAACIRNEPCRNTCQAPTCSRHRTSPPLDGRFRPMPGAPGFDQRAAEAVIQVVRPALKR